MAVSALVAGKEVFVRRIVLVDQELVGEVETDTTERIAGAGRLRDVDGAIRILRQLQPDAVKRLRIFLQSREVFFLDN